MSTTTETDMLIHFWEVKLEYRGLLNPSVQFIIELTIKNLKELRELKEKEDDTNKGAIGTPTPAPHRQDPPGDNGEEREGGGTS
ncbi:MAG: hypothetical protein PHQ43_11035 [Dehalococcoidales bacterium]|nr:hypothetical protein [Dehalococcoidales bacterium]